jgi:YD repeat-containing protein
VRGRKTASSDPDLGAWTYSYDTASELVSQTDAKSQTSTLGYDLLGRMTRRVEPDMTSVGLRHRGERHRQARLGQHHRRAERGLPAQLRL